MATLIGVVSQVVGEVFAVAGDGTRRPLVEGDRVYAGEQLVTGAGGAVAVTLTNGEVLTLGRDSSLNLNEQMLAGGDGQTAQPQEQESAAPSDSDLTDVEQLQAAIEAGVDPTLEGEATAAGPGAGGGGGAGGVGGGHSFVLLGEVGGALDPVIGFPTAGFNTGPEFPDAEPIVDPEPAPAVPVDGLPTAEGATTEVDEDGDPSAPGLAERNTGGSGDSDAPSQVSGALNYSFGPDGPGSFTWNAPNLAAIQSQGHPLSIEISGDGQTLIAFYILPGDGEGEDIRVDVFEVANAGGTYTFTLFEPLDHPVVGTEDELLLQIPFTVTDSDGDAASATLSVTVDDDTPQLALYRGEGEYIPRINGLVHEDALTKSPPDGEYELFMLPPLALDAPHEGNNEDTDPIGSDADPDQTVTFSSHTSPYTPPLSFLVDFGADRIGSFGLVDTTTANLVLGAQGLKSGGVSLIYEVTEYDDGGDPPSLLYTELVAYKGEGGIPIFTLQVEADGHFTFTLQGPIDHPQQDGNDSELWEYLGEGEESYFGIDFTHVLTATDFDGDPVAEFQGDSIDGLFVINIEDDVPRLVGSDNQRPTVTGTVHDDALTLWSGEGAPPAAPYEGNNEDGDPVGSDANPAQTLVASGGEGSLSALVNFGADGPGAFSLIDIEGEGGAAEAALASLTVQGLKSGGEELQHRMDGGVLVGYVEGTEAGDYDVFSLQVNGDGSWTFTLLGPIDHPKPDGDDSELLSDDEGLPIDFSGVLAATDGDGDPLVGGFPSGSFVIDVEDDVPVLAGSENQRPVVSGLVHDDALTLWSGEGAPPAPPYEGNNEDGDPVGSDANPAQTLVASGGDGSLNALVNFGADGPGDFSLIDIEGEGGAAEAALASLTVQGLKSGGEELQYRMDGGVLVGYVEGTEAGDYDVFSLQVNGDGSWTFTLLGPID
ncbi:retention module-containing protein, partial [Aquipseudomonas alcaligenes]|uniref:retention module-containing protein n=1 Tax=Aquipseudomonas alcaligenes TaxID=43263 RepID=UPI001C64F44C